jgi:transposase
MKNFIGIDLHSTNSYIGVIDSQGKRIFTQNKLNDLSIIRQAMKPFKEDNQGIVIESTFNWYWLVDGLMEDGYQVHLANPTAMEQYSGLKYSDDQHDAIWLAEMLRLNILPEGYIYPKEQRSLRDLLRKRTRLVRHRTALLLSVKSMIANSTGERISRSRLKNLEEVDIKTLFTDPLEIISAQSSNTVIQTLNEQISTIEKEVLKRIRLKKEFKKLLSVWGIGDILGITIMLETGNIHRFPSVGNYSSYCRCVSTKRISNGKKKGKGNQKNGNRYLAWAYVEAVHFMQQHHLEAKRWLQRKSAKCGKVVAIKALSNKIARACYFILRDQVSFEPSKLFG